MVPLARSSTASPRPAQGWAFGQFGVGVAMESPIAWLSILLEYSMGPMSKSGRIIGQGNLAEANAMLKKAGNAMATSQRIVFHLSMFFFSESFIQLRFYPLRLVQFAREVRLFEMDVGPPICGKTSSHSRCRARRRQS